MLLKTDENATLRQDVRVAKMQLSFQKSAYENLRSRIAETKAARHDLRHHLSVIESYLQSDNYDELRKYLAEYKSSLPENKELFLCENSAANVIALHYTELAEKEGITVTTNLHLPQEISIADVDLCILLGNCLENALEACRRMKRGPKYIVLKSKVHGDMLGITVDNSFDGKIESNNGRILSRKRCCEEGLGLSSLKAVTKKYNGTVLFRYDEKEFQTSVLLNMRKDP
jgi:sensor histidine kinase regulating citrate/malate metabolism